MLIKLSLSGMLPDTRSLTDITILEIYSLSELFMHAQSFTFLFFGGSEGGGWTVNDNVAEPSLSSEEIKLYFHYTQREFQTNFSPSSLSLWLYVNYRNDSILLYNFLNDASRLKAFL